MASLNSRSILSILSVALLASSVSAAAAPTATAQISPGTYSLTLFPAVTAAPACVGGCLAAATIAAGAHCATNVPSNDCACLNAPGEAQLAIMSCASASCTESQSAYASYAASLYTSYCNGQYLPTYIQSASAAEAPILASISSAMAASSSAAAATHSTSKKGAAAPTGIANEGMLLALGGAIAAVIAL